MTRIQVPSRGYAGRVWEALWPRQEKWVRDRAAADGKTLSETIKLYEIPGLEELDDEGVLVHGRWPRLRPRKETGRDGIMREILRVFSRVDFVWAQRNNTTMFRDERGIPVRGGLGNGAPDIIATLAPSGRLAGIEVKTPGRTPTPEQVAWMEVAHRYGAIAGWVVSTEEAIELVAPEGASGDRHRQLHLALRDVREEDTKKRLKKRARIENTARPPKLARREGSPI